MTITESEFISAIKNAKIVTETEEVETNERDVRGEMVPFVWGWQTRTINVLGVSITHQRGWQHIHGKPSTVTHEPANYSFGGEWAVDFSDVKIVNGEGDTLDADDVIALAEEHTHIEVFDATALGEDEDE